MAVIHDTVTIRNEGDMPSLGMLLGTGSSSSVFDNINSQGYKSFFGSDFDHMRENFVNRYVRSMDRVELELNTTINMISNPDRIRILSSIDDYKAIPPCMEIPILMFEPVRKAFLEGRVEGFGYDPMSLPEEDIYGRIVNNFVCEDVAAASDDDGYFDVEGTMWSDDPELSDDEVHAIRMTREYILDRILNETDRDPTAIGLARG